MYEFKTALSDEFMGGIARNRLHGVTDELFDTVLVYNNLDITGIPQQRPKSIFTLRQSLFKGPDLIFHFLIGWLFRHITPQVLIESKIVPK